MHLTSKLMICGLALSLMACGRGSKIYVDGQNIAFSPPAVWTEAKSPLPADFLDHSVNQAAVVTALGEVTGQPLVFHLRTAASMTGSGSYNGSGTGNRALLGLAGYSGYPFAAISGITFDARTYAGPERLSVILIADLSCDGSTLRVLVADGAALATPAPAAVADGYQRFSARFDESRWKASGGAITHPTDGVLVPSASGNTTSTLAALMNRYPMMCFRNASTGDEGLPNAVPTAAILLALGTPDTTTFNSTLIKRITIGTDVFEDMEWTQ